MVRYSEGANPPTVVRRNQYDQENMFVIFFRTTGLEFIQLFERDDSMSSDYYKDNCLEPPFDNIKQRRPKSDLHAIKLHHDNAKPHQTKSIKMFF